MTDQQHRDLLYNTALLEQIAAFDLILQNYKSQEDQLKIAEKFYGQVKSNYRQLCQSRNLAFEDGDLTNLSTKE